MALLSAQLLNRKSVSPCTAFLPQIHSSIFLVTIPEREPIAAMAEAQSTSTDELMKGSCSVCTTSTTRRCTGCADAPRYDESPSELLNTFYCNAEHQKASWRQHKSKCQKLQARKRLHRAAQLLKEIMLKIRLYASPFHIRKISTEGSTVTIEEYATHLNSAQQNLMPVECCPAENWAFEAGLLFRACTESMIYLNRFVGELLSGQYIMSISSANVLRSLIKTPI